MGHFLTQWKGGDTRRSFKVIGFYGKYVRGTSGPRFTVTQPFSNSKVTSVYWFPPLIFYYIQAVNVLTLVQLRATKVNRLNILGTRFFGENLTTDLKPDGQKKLKNGAFMLCVPTRFWLRQIFEQNFQSIDS